MNLNSVKVYSYCMSMKNDVENTQYIANSTNNGRFLDMAPNEN